VQQPTGNDARLGLIKADSESTHADPSILSLLPNTEALDRLEQRQECGQGRRQH
jgi:hypothetical protein